MTDPSDPVLTPGQDSYVSYDGACTIADGYLFGDAWISATPTARGQALRTATAILDRMRWAGRPASNSQALAWPRQCIRDQHGCPLPAELIPAPVVTACVELAIYMLTNGQLASAPVQMRTLGDAMTMYFPAIADELPKHVRRLIEPFLVASSANVAAVLI